MCGLVNFNRNLNYIILFLTDSYVNRYDYGLKYFKVKVILSLSVDGEVALFRPFPIVVISNLDAHKLN